MCSVVTIVMISNFSDTVKFRGTVPVTSLVSDISQIISLGSDISEIISSVSEASTVISLESDTIMTICVFIGLTYQT